MDLICKLRHMRGSSVDVDGSIYKIDADGLVEAVASADAAVLLQNDRCWEKAPEASPSKAVAPAPTSSMASFLAEQSAAPASSALDLLGFTPAPAAEQKTSAPPARGRRGKE